MKKYVVAGALLLLFAGMFNLFNPYLGARDFEQVTVGRGESVWSIAERYTEKQGDTRQLCEAIMEINGLSHDGAVAAGRVLSVPKCRG